MCGLFGFVNLSRPALAQDELEAGRKALTSLQHRGPDQWNEAIDGPVFIGHRRLSILDLSEEGRQPMNLPDGTLSIAVNGEIYNFQDLKAALGKDRFRSQSDSEVVLHGYRDWGMETLLHKIDGMYAIVVHDKARNTLHLARDRAGIKPLIYARTGDYFIWASELKAIRSFCDSMHIGLETDNSALFDFLTHRYIPGEKTLYKNVRNLEPAHVLSLDLNTKEFQTAQYWALPVSERPCSHDMLAEELRSLLQQSVSEQMVSDVPVGFFLSGGMDSSIMVAQGRKTRADIATFSIGYDHKEHDETHYAGMIAQQFGTHHRKRILSADDAANLIPQILEWYDQPFGDNSALPTWHVCAFAREHATVAISGDGGDELFGGYRWYNRFRSFRAGRPLGAALSVIPQQFLSALPQPLSSRLSLLTLKDPADLYCALVDGMPQHATQPYRDMLEIPADYDALWRFRQFWRNDLPARKKLQYLDFHTFLPDDILTKVDRVSMAVSLEARVPFLSKALIEFAFSLPESFIYKNNSLKGGLKYAFRDILPAEILNRPKKGFSIPRHIWSGKQAVKRTFQQDVFDYARAASSSSS